MRPSWRPLLALALLGVAFALLAGVPAPARGPGDLPGEELDANRRLLERLRRSDPDFYARLKRDWREFAALPEERRARFRQLDEALQEDDAAAQRLWAVLERYTAWLDRLSEEDRRRVAEAPDAAQRLRVVKELREREWVARLPRAQRERVLALPEGEKRAALIAELRKQESDRRAEWVKALRTQEAARPPARDTRVAVQRLREFVQKELTKKERERLQFTSLGDPACLERVIQEFAKQHPEEMRRAKDKKKKGEAETK